MYFSSVWHKISIGVAYTYKHQLGSESRNLKMGLGCVMSCELCQSGNQAEFSTEMMIHFSGLSNIEDPGILEFPKILVCLDCGFSRFVTPQVELARLRKRRVTTDPQPPQRIRVTEIALARGLTG